MKYQRENTHTVSKAHSLPRRQFVICGLALLAGCTESPVVANAAKAVKFLAAGLPDAEFSREMVSKIPYASLSAKIGMGPRSLLILRRFDGAKLHWISADRAVLVTRHGRVVSTAGFPENLKQTISNGRDPVNRQLHLLKNPIRFYRTVDLDLEQRYGITIGSTFSVVGKRLITIAQVEIKTVLVKEYNIARGINWSFTNWYWVDIYDGFIWKSRQHIARTFPPVDLEILKPAI